MKLLGLLIPLLFSSASFANGDWFYKGNGGFVLSCPEKTVQTFDLYEMETRYKLSLDISAVDSVDERMEYLFDRINRLSPARAALYRQWYAQFFNESVFIEDLSLFPIPDLGQATYPSTCNLELAIFQRNPTEATTQRYTINENLWHQLDSKNKAALIFHELIYREASGKENQHKTSESSRFLNAWIQSLEFSTVNRKTFLLTIQKHRLQLGEAHGFKLSLGEYLTENQQWVAHPLFFHSNGMVETASFSNLNAEIKKHIPPFIYKTCAMESLRTNYSGVLRFTRQGQVTDITLNIDPRYKHCFGVFSTSDFSATQEIRSISTNPDNSYFLDGTFDSQQVVKIGKYTFILNGGGQSISGLIRFSPDDQFQSLYFNGSACLNDQHTVIVRKASVARAEVTQFTLSNLETSTQALPKCLY